MTKMLRFLLAASTVLCTSAAVRSLDASYPRSSLAALRAEARINDAPQVPFTNFSAAYVANALAELTDWRTKGAVTPVKDQGPHGAFVSLEPFE